MMRILFLDFDGVLNSHDWNRNRRPPIPEGLEGIHDKDRHARRNLDPACIARLSRIVDETNARVVVSSMWRCDCSLTQLNGWLRRFGDFRHTLLGATPDGWEQEGESGILKARTAEPFLGTRGAEIAAWLALLPSSLERSYAILDDEFVPGHDGRLVRTDNNWGLTDELAAEAIEILLGERA